MYFKDKYIVFLKNFICLLQVHRRGLGGARRILGRDLDRILTVDRADAARNRPEDEKRAPDDVPDGMIDH